MEGRSLEVVNTLFSTSPIVIHAHGSHDNKPNWPPIKAAFFGLPKCELPANDLVTVITCNNGHHAMGIFERSLDHLGLSYRVFGQGIDPWMNSRDKPQVLHEALKTIETPYVLYADSRDAILIGDPAIAVRKFREHFNCKLLFGADRINWPPIRSFQKYEDQLAANYNTEFKYLNSGAWIGETAFCREFFAEAIATPAEEKAPESDQGVLKKLLPAYAGQVGLDYHCEIFQNIGFVNAPIFELNVNHIKPAAIL
jgi:hypothetical protein